MAIASKNQIKKFLQNHPRAVFSIFNGLGLDLTTMPSCRRVGTNALSFSWHEGDNTREYIEFWYVSYTHPRTGFREERPNNALRQSNMLEF